MSSKRVVVLTPHTGTFHAGYVAGLLSVLRSGLVQEVIHFPGSIHMGAVRNRMTEQALSGDAEILLWIDSDIIFTYEDVDALVSLCSPETPMVTGVYAQVSYNGVLSPLVFRLSTDDVPQVAPVDRATIAPERGIVPVSGCGAGFLAIHRVVMEELLEPAEDDPDLAVMRAWNEFWADADSTIGEDLAFCWRARRKGFSLLCDTSVRLGHVKTIDLRI